MTNMPKNIRFLFALGAMFFCAVGHFAMSHTLHAQETAFRSSCTIMMAADPHSGHAFLHVKPNGGVDLTDPHSFKRFICHHFPPLTPVTETIRGGFEVSTNDTTNQDHGTGAGFIVMHLQFESPNQVPADIAMCYSPAGSPCSGIASDPTEFPFPESLPPVPKEGYLLPGYGWRVQPLQGNERSIPATGQSDDKGDVIFDVFAVRAQHGTDPVVNQKPAPQHYVSAKRDTKLEIAVVENKH